MPATVKLTRHLIGVQIRRGKFDVLVDGTGVASIEPTRPSRRQSNPDFTPCSSATAGTRAELRPSTRPRAKSSPTDAAKRGFCQSFSRPSSCHPWRSPSGTSNQSCGARRAREPSFGPLHRTAPDRSRAPRCASDDDCVRQVSADVAAAPDRGRNCLVLIQWVAHLGKLAEALRAMGYEPVVLRGGMGARTRAAAVSRLQPEPDGPPLLVVATGPTPGKASTARPWTPCSLLPRSAGKDASSNTPGGSCALTPARKPQRSTTTTTRAPESSPQPWQAARPATPASASPTPAGSRRPRARPAPPGSQPSEAMRRRLACMNYVIGRRLTATGRSSRAECCCQHSV
jgi:hypothetical protein